MASEGDLILIEPGTYTGSVAVETPGITIRGIDRNEVILDGQDSDENGIKVFSDGVTVENLTAHSFRGNGVFFSGNYSEDDPLQGMAVRHVTAYNNGLYGIYAFGVRGGVIEDTYTSGHPDAGLYVGQCYPCDMLLADNVAELNQNGFEGANAGGDLYVVSSTFRNNRVGIQSVSTTRERLYPQREAAILSNLVVDNTGVGAPSSTEGYGSGIVIAGGRSNRVMNNVVSGNTEVGIIVSEFESFVAEFNRVENNTATANGIDLAYVNGDGTTRSNCFGGNTFDVSSPAEIQRALNCAPETTGGTGDVTFDSPPPAVSYLDVPAPPPQPGMTDPETSSFGPAPADVPFVDEASLEVPSP